MAGSVGRRTVLRGAALTAGGAVLSACGGESAAPVAGAPSPAGSAAPPATPSPGAGSSGAGSSGAGSSGSGAPALAALDDVPVGSALSVTSADGPVLLVRTTETEVTGFSAVCPHQGCTVAPADSGLVCPCHGSSFDLTTGQVLQGPATADLSSYPVTVVDGSIVPA